jgi:hypothetical protein
MQINRPYCMSGFGAPIYPGSALEGPVHIVEPRSFRGGPHFRESLPCGPVLLNSEYLIFGVALDSGHADMPSASQLLLALTQVGGCAMPLCSQLWRPGSLRAAPALELLQLPGKS